MTGDASSLAIADSTDLAQQLLGIPAAGQTVAAETSQISNVPAVRGQAGEPATLIGKPMNIDPKDVVFSHCHQSKLERGCGRYFKTNQHPNRTVFDRQLYC